MMFRRLIVATVFVLLSYQNLLAQPATAPAPPKAAPTETTSEFLQLGNEGQAVEWLQRTLNARLEPSPKLEIDGSFGDETVAAVKQFQESHHLPADGKVRPEVWKQLGLLITSKTPVMTPEIVNSQSLEKLPEINPNGLPHVTCKAWVICDGKTGEVLWQHQKDKRLATASTTKMMTAYLVVTLAKEKPEVLEEIVTFSKRADKTPGSSSKILTGEQLTVGELLYGLLLPSGNDASVALAEHFGGRLYAARIKSNEKLPNAHDRFIAVMNRQAEQLGMTNTTYKNPHGLDCKGHQSSAQDLAKLARHGMQNPLFRKVVGTVTHGTRLNSTLGYERNIVWNNTNRLLRQEGFFGVKTGTTRNAGACLVSYGSQNGQDLILVVLGATSKDARYTDSRNLYQWAWKKRGKGEEAKR